MEKPISSSDTESSDEIITKDDQECEIHSEESSEEQKSKKDLNKIVSKKKKIIEVDLNEQDNEFIIEARETLLSHLDETEQNAWPKTRKELVKCIRENCEVKNSLDGSTILSFLMYTKILTIANSEMSLNPTAVLQFRFDTVFAVMKTMNQKKFEGDKFMAQFAEIIISDSTVLIMQKVVAYLRLNIDKLKDNYKNVRIQKLNVLLQTLSEECFVVIVVSPEIIIEELQEMNFLTFLDTPNQIKEDDKKRRQERRQKRNKRYKAKREKDWNQ
jgi:hypothetical protein